MEQQIGSLIRALSGFGAAQMEDVGLLGFFFVLGVSLVSGIFIAHLYKFFYSGRTTGSQIHRAFPLLAISVTAIFVTIQFSLPLSLGLLGALSIVRFRTPIKEPEEIGFVMLVVASSLICATFNYAFLGVMLLTAVAGLAVLHAGWLNQAHEDGLVVVTLGNEEYQIKYPKLISLLGDSTVRGKIDSISKTGNSSIISYSFRSLGKKTMQELQRDLDALAGNSTYDIFLNQQRVS
jgi:hypothetical protein